MPKVSVIMSVFNGIQFIERAVESILNQTEKDLELLIIDDGSTEPIFEIIAPFMDLDNRIVVCKSPSNKGLTYQLNQCLEWAEGNFIVRMDGDDISLPTRIEKQIAAFEKGVGFVGCWGRSVDANGESIVHFVDTNCRCSNEDLKTVYPKTLCMIDASSIYSREAVEKIGYFDEQSLTAETYNYNRRIQQFFEGRVVQEILYVRTVWSGSVMRKIDTSTGTVALANRRALEQPIIRKIA